MSESDSPTSSPTTTQAPAEPAAQPSGAKPVAPPVIVVRSELDPGDRPVAPQNRIINLGRTPSEPSGDEE